MRTGDVARLAGCSVQQVRRLERTGVLPPAGRTPSGYRVHTGVHVRSALAYRALAEAAGPAEAADVLRAVRDRPVAEVLGLLDAAHARLDAERRLLAAARSAAASIGAEPVLDERPEDSMTVSELAGALGVRTSTLRHWDAAGLLAPGRDGRGHRRYGPAQVRDARVVQQLRLAGHGVEALRELVPHLRLGGDLPSVLAARDRSTTSRSRALLRACAHLDDLLG
ncbi:MerR family transcriptional regulator [Kineococcus sp. NUM-3379]